MTCHTRPEVRAFFDTICPVLGVEFGQREWHIVRHMVESVSERSLSRAYATPEDALATARNVAEALNLHPRQVEVLDTSVGLMGTRFRKGTLVCVDFMADLGFVTLMDLMAKYGKQSLVRDFLGRHLTLDGNWLVEKEPGEAGHLVGWRVSMPRNPETPHRVFRTLNEARAFVEAQPDPIYPGARRLDTHLNIYSTVCPHGHISNFTSEIEPFACKVCARDITDLPLVHYSPFASFTADEIEAVFMETDES